MNLADFLHWFTQHDTLAMVIQWLIAIIALLSLSLLGVWIFSKDKPQDPTENLGELEETLKKVLEQTKGIGGADGVALGEGAGAAAPEELLELQQELQAKQVLVAELEAKVSGEGDDAALDEYKSRIAELEGRLVEYEIIEDDIADLSRFKEENEQMRIELAKVKSEGGAEAAPVPTPEVVSEAPVEDVAEEAAPAGVAKEAAVAEASSPEGEDLVAEFASAVTQSKEVVGEVVKAAEEVVASQAESTDILAEFSPEEAAQEAPKKPAVSEEPEKSVDTDKMLAEMDSLAAMVGGSTEGSGLEEDMDVDKMAAEASELSSSDR